MTHVREDIWCQWMLKRRFGDDPYRLRAVMDRLRPIRDKVLLNAKLGDRETLLDVGCGDGLIAFGALERVPTSRVIFSDISQDLLDHSETLARDMGLLSRCQFIHASADDLSMFTDNSIDMITTRSVLIYVSAKQQTFDEFYRVLKTRGRFSIFEPINRFGCPQPPHMCWGFDVTPVQEIGQKVKAVYDQIQPLDTDPMMNFDERDLMAFAERAGFKEVHLELQAEVKPFTEIPGWDTFIHTAANPRIPTFEEAMQQVLTSAKREAFVAYLRPTVEAKQGTDKSAHAYLWGTKF